MAGVKVAGKSGSLLSEEVGTPRLDHSAVCFDIEVQADLHL